MIIPAHVARSITRGNFQYSDIFTGIMNDIISEAKYGNSSFNYCTNGNHMSNEEEEIIRALGYSLEWNRPCLWYEVSWKD